MTSPTKDACFAPITHDSEFQCSLCKRRYSNELQLNGHLEFFHKINPIANPTKLLADVNDPDLYCSACKKHFFFLKKKAIPFILRRLHNIDLFAIRQPIIYPHIIPDIDYPNHHCSACEKTFDN